MKRPLPIHFVFGDGLGDYPTVLHASFSDRHAIWIFLGFSRRLPFNPRNDYISTVFDMGRRQIPPWFVIRRSPILRLRRVNQP